MLAACINTTGETTTTELIDQSGNVWVSNASCVATTSTACAASGFTLSEIVGVASPTIVPSAAVTVSTFATKPVK